MRLALADLDTGLFFGKLGWTTDRKLAQIFADSETVSKVATENQVRNAAAAMMDGDPLQPTGFLWLTKPSLPTAAECP